MYKLWTLRTRLVSQRLHARLPQSSKTLTPSAAECFAKELVSSVSQDVACVTQCLPRHI